MSKFRIKLNNVSQGRLDVNPASKSQAGAVGSQFAVSLQRQVYLTGPEGQRKIYSDGEEFEGSNYYKQFAVPALPLDQAFIEVLEDDATAFTLAAGDVQIFSKGEYPIGKLEVLSSVAGGTSSILASVPQL